VRHLPDDVKPVKEREQKQSEAGEMFHAQERPFIELPVTEGHSPA